MNYEQIKTGLKEYDSTRVDIFIKYLKQLETEVDKNKALKNWWYKENLKESDAIGLFKQVALDNLFIDGETITIGYKGKVLITYNYQAYKNRLLNAYSETQIDIQVVYQGDTFSFKKENGHVLYHHSFGSPFENKRTAIGAYCIIKNRRGEFIETINNEEIAKMKSSATTQNVWNNWEGEMIKKSIIKRSCKTHFKDIVQNMDKLENENYDLELSNLTDKDAEIRLLLEAAETEAEVIQIYKDNKDTFSDHTQLVKLCGGRKSEIIEKLKNK
jgi:recombinational DNA repair protein RecT